MKNAGCADDGRIEEVFFDVCHIEMEGTGCVNYSFERRVGYDSFIKGIGKDIGKVASTVAPIAQVATKFIREEPEQLTARDIEMSVISYSVII